MDNASAIQASDAVAADWATGDADDAIDYQNLHSLTPMACGRAPARRH
jgi:hypothetical protein